MNLELRQHIETKLNQWLSTTFKWSWFQISGGSINSTYKISCKHHDFFIKTNTVLFFENGFKEEVLGLQFLQNHSALVPSIILEGSFNNHIYLVLEWIESCTLTNKFWQNFGFQLAKLHQQKSEKFGLEYSNYMGQLHQKNTFFNNFSEFYIENRLKPQVKLAFNSNKLQQKQIGQFENFYQKLADIFPTEKPCAVHGDLWSGNFINSINEKAVLIDPAVYYGYREVDLAMTLLFGGFSSGFYNSYEDNYPLEIGFNNRKDYYNLYPLLIHLNLFGNSYLKSIENIITKF